MLDKRLAAYDLIARYLRCMPALFVIHTAMCFLQESFQSGTYSVTHALFLMLFFMIAFFLREMIGQVGLRVLFMALAVVLTSVIIQIWTSDTPIRVVLIGGIVLSALYALLYGMPESPSWSLLFWGVLFAAIALRAEVGGDQYLRGPLLAQAVIVIASLVVRFHLNAVRAFLRTRACRRSSRDTISKLMTNSQRQMIMFALLVCVLSAMVLLPVYPLLRFDMPSLAPEQTPLDQMRTIEQTLQGGQAMLPAEVPLQPEAAEEMPTEIIIQDEEANNIIFLIASLLGIPVFALLLFLLLIKVRKNAKRAAEADILEYEEEMITEDIDGINLNRGRMAGKRQSLNEEVRRAFTKKAKDLSRKGKIHISQSTTAQDIVNDARNLENIDDLGSLYHKARYSPDEITSAEWKSYKEQKT